MKTRDSGFVIQATRDSGKAETIQLHHVGEAIRVAEVLTVFGATDAEVRKLTDGTIGTILWQNGAKVGEAAKVTAQPKAKKVPAKAKTSKGAKAKAQKE